MSRVELYKCHDYADAPAHVTAALENFCPPLDGKRVLIKPNILGPCPPEMCVTTHPSLVRAAVDYCRSHGAAEVIVGDNPGMTGYGDSDHVAGVSGIMDAADGCYRNLAQKRQMVANPTGRGAALPVSSEVLRADVLINLAKMKTHVATGMTGAVKNTFGYIVGAAKTRLHAENPSPVDFAAALAGVFALRPPDVSIVDAVMAMEGQGPSGGKPRYVGLIIASTDALAADAVICRLMGIDARQVLYLKTAADMNLGQIDLEKIEIAGGGNADSIEGFRPPSIGRGLGTFIARWLSWLFVTQPRANRSKCVRCGTCARQCPVEAIVMKPYPKIDATKCISCYCCHEFCKFHAMDLAPRSRILKRLRQGRR